LKAFNQRDQNVQAYEIELPKGRLTATVATVSTAQADIHIRKLGVSGLIGSRRCGIGSARLKRWKVEFEHEVSEATRAATLRLPTAAAFKT
jgi:hypothetical protein